MNFFQLKINSLHLSSAKGICPNSGVLESQVFDFGFKFWKNSFMAFKGLMVNLSILFLLAAKL